jgi:predicted short-subunit dehydrogenase-like oxidoreductase (DUF2520 family)
MTPRIVIVGLGRVGGAFALGLKRAGWRVTIAPRSKASFRRAKSLKLKVATPNDFAAADLCILAVPDAAISTVAATMPAGPALVHCAGAFGLDVLPSARKGSFHPLVAVSDPRDPVAGHWVAIAASDAKLKTHLAKLAKALKMNAFEVPEAKRAQYHAGAVMSAGLVVALLDAAAEATGLPRADIEPALVALARSALRGAGKRGLKASLTGPIVRGDAAVVAKHLATLPPPLAALYRDLSRRALKMLGAAISKTRLLAALE